MRTFSENASNDLYLNEQNSIAVSTGIDAVLLLCKGAIEVIIGEMIYQIDAGMPLFESAFNFYRPAQFEAAARQRLTAVPDVTGVSDFTVNKRNNALVYTATIDTIYGRGSING